MDANLTNIFVTAIGTIVTFSLPIFLRVFFRWFALKVDKKYAELVADEIGEAVSTAVESVAQTFVNDLKAKSEDGHLTEAEQREALHTAINSVYLMLSDDTYKYLEKKITDGDVGAYIEAKIEQYIGIRESIC